MEREVLGTIYTNSSEDFQRGMYPIARTIKAEQHDLAVVIKENMGDYSMEVKQIGNLSETLETFYDGVQYDYEKIPCQLDKQDFQSLDEAGIKNFNTDVSGTITARYYKGIGANGDNMVIEKEVKQAGNIISGGSWENPQAGRIYSSNGCSPTINTCQGGSREPKVIVAMRGRNPDNPSDRTAGIQTEQRLEPNSQGICNTLTSVQKDNMVLEKSSQYRIRKLTPLECWRLMGFSDEDFLSAKMGSREEANKILENYPHLGKRAFTEVQRLEKMSNSQLYKQAGNSIVNNVLMAIFETLI